MKLRGRPLRRGATMLELAFVLPAMLLLIVGAVELGRGVWTYTTLAHAVQEGARLAAVEESVDLDRMAARVADAAVGLDAERLEVTLTEQTEPADSLEIAVRYPFDFIAGSLFGAGDGIVLESSARAPIPH